VHVSIEQPITTSVATLTADGVAARNEHARAHALQHTVKTDNLIPATVSYQSQGACCWSARKIAFAAPPACCPKA
jgi:hypothetical protein